MTDYLFNEKRFDVSLGVDDLTLEYAYDIAHNTYESWVVKYLDLVAKVKGDACSVVDVGANVGLLSIALSELFRNGTVHSFEPLPNIYEVLEGNLKKNEISNVLAMRAAVGESPHETFINIPNNREVGGAFTSDSEIDGVESYQVDVLRLDDYLQDKEQKLGIIKIDVEGDELSVINGAEKSIKEHSPVLFVEFNVDKRTYEDELRASQLYKKLKESFKHIYLINRHDSSLIPIYSYSWLRSIMMTGHFVEDLVCLNDEDVQEEFSKHIRNPEISTYYGSRCMVSPDMTLSMFSIYPDGWTYGHDFVALANCTKPKRIMFQVSNLNAFESNRIQVVSGDKVDWFDIEEGDVELVFDVEGRGNGLVYIFSENSIDASSHFCNADPRVLGVNIKFEVIGV